MERQRAQEATVAATVAAEETIALYDACWFHRCVLLPSRPHPALAQAQPVPAGPTASLWHRRTRSDEAASTAFQAPEPLRIVPNTRARLETVLSGKEGMLASPQPRRQAAGAGRRRRRGRSMSELELRELKGLQDLGFTFSDAEVDAELASIVPGLRRKKRSEEEDAAAADAPEPEPRRPYLSEAWDEEEEAVRRMLRNWRIPAAVDGADMRKHILEWAHTVASAVR